MEWLAPWNTARLDKAEEEYRSQVPVFFWLLEAKNTLIAHFPGPVPLTALQRSQQSPSLRFFLDLKG